MSTFVILRCFLNCLPSASYVAILISASPTALQFYPVNYMHKFWPFLHAVDCWRRSILRSMYEGNQLLMNTIVLGVRRYVGGNKYCTVFSSGILRGRVLDWGVCCRPCSLRTLQGSTVRLFRSKLYTTLHTVPQPYYMLHHAKTVVWCTYIPDIIQVYRVQQRQRQQQRQWFWAVPYCCCCQLA